MLVYEALQTVKDFQTPLWSRPTLPYVAEHCFFIMKIGVLGGEPLADATLCYRAYTI